MEQPTKHYEDMTIREKMEIVEVMAIFPALTVMVFIRRRIGYRLLKHEWLACMMIILIVVASIFPTFGDPHRGALIVYAIAMFGIGTFVRLRRWNDLCLGVRWHTYSGGLSWLELIPFPFLQRCRRYYRFIEPPIVMLIGLAIGALLSHGLGAWIMFSGLMLFIYEEALFKRILARELDTLDSLVFAEIQSESAKFFSGPQLDEQVRKLEDTAGIPTGVAPDIEKQVEIRKAKRRPAPDNLAREQAAAAT